jgi:hypothetical protein
MAGDAGAGLNEGDGDPAPGDRVSELDETTGSRADGLDDGVGAIAPTAIGLPISALMICAAPVNTPPNTANSPPTTATWTEARCLPNQLVFFIRSPTGRQPWHAIDLQSL